jgi:hypothetical protein
MYVAARPKQSRVACIEADRKDVLETAVNVVECCFKNGFLLYT